MDRILRRTPEFHTREPEPIVRDQFTDVLLDTSAAEFMAVVSDARKHLLWLEIVEAADVARSLADGGAGGSRRLDSLRGSGEGGSRVEGPFR